MEYFVDQWSF